MEIVLALGSAISYGVSDFVGGLLSKTLRVLVVVVLSQVVSTAMLLAAVPFWEGEVTWRAFGWGGGAGLAAAAGTSLLYRGLAIGRMSVVAPITGVLAAAIPVVFGLSLGERPGAMALVGVGIGIAAVVLVTWSPPSTTVPGGEAPSTRGVAEAFGSGVGFGLFFTLLERSPADSGLWPLVGMRLSQILALGIVIAAARVAVRLPAGMPIRIVALGAMGGLADLLFLSATRRGLLSLVAVISSLYPAVTVILARSILREPMFRAQLVGLCLAAGSVALIAAG